MGRVLCLLYSSALSSDTLKLTPAPVSTCRKLAHWIKTLLYYRCSVNPVDNRHYHSSSTGRHEVFLGGSCNPTTWRVDTAIPALHDAAVTYFNPQVEEWFPELIEIEEQAKMAATLLLFVVDNQTRAISSMVEIAYLAGRLYPGPLCTQASPSPLLVNPPLCYTHRPGSRFGGSCGGYLFRRSKCFRRDIVS